MTATLVKTTARVVTTSTASRASVTPIITALCANTRSQRHSYRRRFPALQSPIRGPRRRIRALQPDVMSRPPQRHPPGTTTHVTQLVVARKQTRSKETEQMYVLVAVWFFVVIGVALSSFQNLSRLCFGTRETNKKISGAHVPPSPLGLPPY